MFRIAFLILLALTAVAAAHPPIPTPAAPQLAPQPRFDPSIQLKVTHKLAKRRLRLTPFFLDGQLIRTDATSGLDKASGALALRMMRSYQLARSLDACSRADALCSNAVNVFGAGAVLSFGGALYDYATTGSLMSHRTDHPFLISPTMVSTGRGGHPGLTLTGRF